jgi:hypothetical protein
MAGSSSAVAPTVDDLVDRLGIEQYVCLPFAVSSFLEGGPSKMVIMNDRWEDSKVPTA